MIRSDVRQPNRGCDLALRSAPRLGALYWLAVCPSFSPPRKKESCLPPFAHIRDQRISSCQDALIAKKDALPGGSIPPYSGRLREFP